LEVTTLVSSKTDNKQLRTRLVLEAYDYHGTLTSAALATHLGLTSLNDFFHSRRIKHIIGDLVFEGLLVRTGANSRANGRALALFQMTREGWDQLAELTSRARKPLPVGLSPADLRKVEAVERVVATWPVQAPSPVSEPEEVVVAWTQDPPGAVHLPGLSAPKPTPLAQPLVFRPAPLGAGKPVVRPQADDRPDAPENKIIPLPPAVVVPPYPGVGRMTASELSELERLRGVYQALKNRGESQLLTLCDIVGKLLKREAARDLAAANYQAALALALTDAHKPAGAAHPLKAV
jgi:hypothetical protein